MHWASPVGADALCICVPAWRSLDYHIQVTIFWGVGGLSDETSMKIYDRSLSEQTGFQDLNFSN